MSSYPLQKGESAEKVRQEAGKCNNFNYRFSIDSQGKRNYEDINVAPVYIVQHYTAATQEETRSTFLNNENAVSAHFVIDKDGTIFQYVDPFMRAYHAGAGKIRCSSLLNPIYSDTNYMNSYSIGIENINNSWEEYSREQMYQNLLLCDYLCDTIPSLRPELMIGHQDWSSKIDPGPYFPWKLFANAKKASQDWEYKINRNFGIYPKIKDSMDKDSEGKNIRINIIESSAVDYLQLISEVQEKLYRLGYIIAKDEMDNSSFGRTTKLAIFKANIKYFGEEIIANQDLLKLWHVLVDDTEYGIEKTKAQEGLSFLSYEMNLMLGDVVEQYEESNLKVC